MNWAKALGYVIRYAPLLIEVVKKVLEEQKHKGELPQGAQAFLSKVK